MNLDGYGAALDRLLRKGKEGPKDKAPKTPAEGKRKTVDKQKKL